MDHISTNLHESPRISTLFEQSHGIAHRWDGVEAARRDDFRTASLCLVLMLLDHAFHPCRLARQVTVVNPGTRAGSHEFVSITSVRPDRCDHDLVAVVWYLIFVCIEKILMRSESRIKCACDVVLSAVGCVR